MILWVGLGNPGRQYQNTRHNMGEKALWNILEEKFPVASKKTTTKFNSLIWESPEAVFLFPQTFMNLSGNAVGPAMRFYKIPTSAMVVFHDEIDLPEGEIKYKLGGGHRGHNGLRDIIAKTGSADFHRIRIGVGRPPDERMSVADYVLSKSSQEPDMPAIRELLEKNGLFIGQ